MKATLNSVISHLKLKFDLLIALLKIPSESFHCSYEKILNAINIVSRERVGVNEKDGPCFFKYLTVPFLFPTQLYVLGFFQPQLFFLKILHSKRLKMYILNQNKNIPKKALLESKCFWGTFQPL